MKCPVCGYAMLETDPECLRCVGFAQRGVSRRRVRAERLVTVLLVLILLAGLAGLTVLAHHRQEAVAQGLLQKQAAQQTSSSTEAAGTQAAKQDAQGDQSSDE